MRRDLAVREHVNEELALTMTLAGCARLSDITADLLYGDPMFRASRFDAASSERGTK